MVLVSRVAAGLVMIGFALIGLGYLATLPTWLAYGHAMAVAGTICIGVLLCHPYLEVRGQGFQLGDKAGRSPYWSNALMIVSVVVAVVLAFTSGRHEVRVLTGMANFFVCVIALWCGAAANAKPSTASLEPDMAAGSASGSM